MDFQGNKIKLTESPKSAFKRYKQCKVCGDVALSFNFGIPTCSSCKSFFRRYSSRDVKSMQFVQEF